MAFISPPVKTVTCLDSVENLQAFHRVTATSFTQETRNVMTTQSYRCVSNLIPELGWSSVFSACQILHTYVSACM